MKLQNKVRMGGAGRRSEARLLTNLVAVMSRNVPVAVNCSFLVLCNVFVHLFLLLHQPDFLFVTAFYWFLFLHGIGPNKNVVYVSFLERYFNRGRSEWGRCLSSLHVPEGPSLSPVEFHRSRQALNVLLCGSYLQMVQNST